MKQTPITDTILVIVPCVEGVNLPAQTAPTVIGVPAVHLLVEDGLGEGEPLGLGGGGVGEGEFGGGHGCEAPETLVVVAFAVGLVGGHVVVVGADLEAAKG
jgi:hypothetical protein